MVCQGSIADLAQRLSAEAHGPFAVREFRGISTDTRHLRPGELFVALAGESFDGHDFIPQALDSGAVGALCSRSVNGPHLRVGDTLAAYQQLARWWRSRFQIPVMAITGSAGKTSTKELLAAALSRYGAVLKSAANHNNDIGVPQTLLQLDETHAFAVLEMAMRGPGEIARLARTARPTHGIIVNVGTAHIGRLGSREAIAAAKCELLQELNPAKGTAILNGEDGRLLRTAQQVWSGSTMTYGLDAGEVQGSWQPEPPQIAIDGLTLPVPLRGRHHSLNYMAVVATLKSLGLELQRLTTAIDLPVDLPGRNQILTLPDDVQVFDETYNAAPEAAIAALQLLRQTPGQRYIAVLGPMRELGHAAAELYAAVGAEVARLDIDVLCLLDPDGEMESLARAVPSPRVHRFEDKEVLAGWLSECAGQGDRLLFKAARSIQLETVLQQFVAKRSESANLNNSLRFASEN